MALRLSTDSDFLELFTSFIGLGRMEFEHDSFEVFIKLLIHLKNKL
jgi:hypothetical protein